MNNAFFYLQHTTEQFSVNLTNFLGETILLGREIDKKFDYRKQLQALKTHLCFHSNYHKTKSCKGFYGFEIRTCWDELIAQSIFFETREERDNAMNEVFQANKVAELKEIALHIYSSLSIPRAS